MVRNFAILISILLICVGLSDAAELRVPGDYASIKEAMTAAVDGDVVIVADGTYNGDDNRDMYFNGKAITVRSENGPAACIIDCEGNAGNETRAFFLDNYEENDSVIDGFTIINGYKTGGGVNGNGAAIYCRTGSPIIRNCIITNCTASHDAVRTQTGGAVISNCIIAGNTGIALTCYEGSKTINNCVIVGNTFGLLTEGASVRVRNCVVRDNISDDITKIDGTLDIAYSNIEGGYAGEGNFDTAPGFVADGYWDDNGTPADDTDDFWVMGDYNLTSISDCIDSGDPSFGASAAATDLAGNDRVIDGFVDLGAYEYGTDYSGTITVTKMTVKAGRTRNTTAPTDSFDISTYYEIPWTPSGSAATVDVRIGPYEESLDATQFVLSGSGTVYNYKGSTGAVNSARIDADKHTIRVKARNIDLTGLTAPIPVSVVIGSSLGYGVAEDEGTNDVINRTKDIPLQLLSGYADGLAMSRARVTGRDDTNVTVMVQGYIAVMDDTVDITSEEMTINIANTELTIPGVDGFSQRGTTRNYSYRGTRPDDGSAYIATAMFNLDKCTFKVIVKNLDISSETSPLNMRITFGYFGKAVQGIEY